MIFMRCSKQKREKKKGYVPERFSHPDLPYPVVTVGDPHKKDLALLGAKRLALRDSYPNLEPHEGLEEKYTAEWFALGEAKDSVFKAALIEFDQYMASQQYLRNSLAKDEVYLAHWAAVKDMIQVICYVPPIITV